MGADGGEDVGDPALKAMLVEEPLELIVGVGLDGRDKKLGLAREAPVDGPRRVARPAGDLGHTGAVVAVLSEHLSGGRDQLLANRVRGLGMS